MNATNAPYHVTVFDCAGEYMTYKNLQTLEAVKAVLADVREKYQGRKVAEAFGADAEDTDGLSNEEREYLLVG